MSDSNTPTGLFIERVGTRQYAGTNDRGATISIGHGEGQWSPGELLKLALLGCNAMSADSRLARSLGEDFQMGAVVDAVYNKDEDRYESMSVELIPEFGDADEETVAKAKKYGLLGIDRYCTVGHTLDHVVPHTATITKED
ncbi:OsmC family protein [Scrofimicrobium sp. R131]|uniref:OsmC family protein n=1 Tax=Scrofimicrobium appendicitidis TaxID=3079930 RepID=A0AAU7V6C1_9ACTO